MKNFVFNSYAHCDTREAGTSISTFFTRPRTIYSFKISNVSIYDIPKLIAVVEFYDKNGNKLHTYKQNLITKKEAFKPTSEPINVNMIIRTKKNLVQKYNNIELKLYLAKNEKVLSQLYSVEVIDVTKGKVIKK